MKRPLRTIVVLPLLLWFLLPGRWSPATPPVAFEKIILTDQYYCDGIGSGDFNRDGRRDIVAGPFWYAGPDFETEIPFHPPVAHDPAASPSDSLFSFVHDFSGDGWDDILVLGRVHKHEAFWYENPRKECREHWEKHFVFHRVQGENPPFGDLTGDGRPELIALHENRWGYLAPDWENPRREWTFHPVTEPGEYHQFYHGEGIGDLSGDGLPDLVLNELWCENPGSADAPWTAHRITFSQERGGCQMPVLDIDLDGDNDVVSAIDSHGWGLAWYEARKRDGRLAFTEHKIMGTREEIDRYGVAFTQPHALAMGDIDGDGLEDLVVGKRRWAHGPDGDIEPNAAPVLYWFRRTIAPDGQVRFTPHRIDDASGVGVQLVVDDVNGDGRNDVLTASKLGSFVFLNRAAEKDTP